MVKGTTIGYRVSLVKAVSDDDIRFNGSEHHSLNDAEEFVNFFDDHDKITGEINPINYWDGLSINTPRFIYRDYTILVNEYNKPTIIRFPGYYTSSDQNLTQEFSGSVHEAFNYIDRIIFDNDHKS